MVQLLPDPGQALLLATVRLAGPYRAQPGEFELHAAIPRRHTNRGPFSGRPVPPGVLAELTEAAGLEGAMLHVLDHDETVRVLHLGHRQHDLGLAAKPCIAAGVFAICVHAA